MHYSNANLFSHTDLHSKWSINSNRQSWNWLIFYLNYRLTGGGGRGGVRQPPTYSCLPAHFNFSHRSSNIYFCAPLVLVVSPTVLTLDASVSHECYLFVCFECFHCAFLLALSWIPTLARNGNVLVLAGISVAGSCHHYFETHTRSVLAVEAKRVTET